MLTTTSEEIEQQRDPLGDSLTSDGHDDTRRDGWGLHAMGLLAALALIVVLAVVVVVGSVTESGPVFGFKWWFKIPSHFFHFGKPSGGWA